MSIGLSCVELSNPMNRSPSSNSVFSKDCRQLQQWIDGREMLFFSLTDEKTEPSEISQLNNELEQVYFTATGQIMMKIPQKMGQIEFLLNRTVKGMHSCFLKQLEITKKIVGNFLKQKDEAI